ncbi:hypothetical protein SELMODRAFT_425550 [Selaginella moellendorffii]|uniref:Uncharacterized protein n=1 Tax=Selaginella moellendorffii TaxID=88036 RepID=D8STG8_SELML|nr:hypothetical protein SELMODRAFT_425550 [Selaginella moellendorffii]
MCVAATRSKTVISTLYFGVPKSVKAVHWISERGVLSAPNKPGQEILQSKRLLESISVAMHQTQCYLYRKQLTTHCQARCRLRKTMVFLSQADFFQYFFMPNEAKLLNAFSCALAQQQQGGSHSRVTGQATFVAVNGLAQA